MRRISKEDEINRFARKREEDLSFRRVAEKTRAGVTQLPAREKDRERRERGIVSAIIYGQF